MVGIFDQRCTSRSSIRADIPQTPKSVFPLMLDVSLRLLSDSMKMFRLFVLLTTVASAAVSAQEFSFGCIGYES